MDEMRAKSGHHQADNGRHDTTCTVTCVDVNQARQERPKSMQHLQFMWEVRVYVCVRGMIR